MINIGLVVCPSLAVPSRNSVFLNVVSVASREKWQEKNVHAAVQAVKSTNRNNLNHHIFIC